MIALPFRYKFIVFNESNVPIASGALDLYGRRAKFGTDGVLQHESSEMSLTSASEAADDTYEDIGGWQENDAVGEKWLGGDFVFSVLTPGSGTVQDQVTLGILIATDDGETHAADDALFIPLCTIAVAATSTTYVKAFTI